MSSQQDGNADTDILPLKWKPGTDHMSKLLLNDPNVINLIVRSLVGEIAPENSYTVAQTEWTDTKGKFTVYIPQNAEDDRFIPVLIAIQEEVNHASMLKIIEYCTRIYEEFRLLPTVLIISIKGWSSLEDREGFSADDDSFLGQLKCSFWAQKCFLFFS
ncbi:hypothetical protein INT47_003790 [Mucor saturninus]|uniref:Uncharacterized protein n=1 Tax=Mucor saturninus TaxID=64648 RepID=A0A8H7R7V2_9FUNG|nr:hypothetical protein INT47_003790 [Mucor saturninus]